MTALAFYFGAAFAVGVSAIQDGEVSVVVFLSAVLWPVSFAAWVLGGAK